MPPSLKDYYSNEAAACESKLCKKNAAQPSRPQIGQEFKCLVCHVSADEFPYF